MATDSRDAGAAQPSAIERMSATSWMVLTLMAAWMFEVILYGAIYLTVHLVPNCELGGKISQTSCGGLTSTLSSAHVLAFYLGSILVVATIPWIVVVIIVGWLSRNKNAA